MHANTIESKHFPLHVWRVPAWVAAVLVVSLSSGCASSKTGASTGQMSSTTQVQVTSLRASDIQADGIAFITPSSITGQEEDRSPLALAFTEEVRTLRPDLRCVTLSETLSAVNRAGLATEYKRMFEDSRLTDIFDREVLQKISRVTGARYLAQLKLSGFHQEAKGRFGFLGLRISETKTATIRLFLQIWDSQDGAVVWEGSQELTIAYESMSEDPVSLQRTVEASAREILMRFPAKPLTQAELEKRGSSTVIYRTPAPKPALDMSK
jgi:hypothetical protein